MSFSWNHARLGVAIASLSWLIILHGEASAALVAHWDLEEGSGTTTTAAVGSPAADGTFVDGARWENQFLPPVIGGTTASGSLAGSPEAITTGYAGILGNSARTIAAWVRVDANQPDHTTLVSWGSGDVGNRFSFRVHSTGTNVGALRLEISGDYAIGETLINDGQWHHVAVVVPDNDPDSDGIVDLDDITFYVDGQAETAFAEVGDANIEINTLTPAGMEVALGSSPHDFSRYSISGGLDDVRIYDTALDAATIGALVPASIGQFGLVVNRQTGNITWSNTTGNGINFVAYSITSDGDTLDPGQWLSIADTSDADSGGSVDPDDNWFEFTPPTDRDDLSEAEQPGGNGVTLASAGSIDLGNAWIQNPTTEDLKMVALIADGGTINVPVKFTGLPIPVGDMDFDGDVDGLDWPIFRANLFSDLSGLSPAEQYQKGDLDGDGDNDGDDFVMFKGLYETAYGAGSFDQMVAGVPEPSSLALLAFAVSVVTMARRRKNVARRAATMASLLSVVLMAALCFSNTANANPLAYWDFEEGTGTTMELISRIPSAADATFNGAGIAAGSSDALALSGGTTTVDSTLDAETIGFDGTGAFTVVSTVSTTNTGALGTYFNYTPTGGVTAGADLRLFVGSNGLGANALRVEASNGAGGEFVPTGITLNDGNPHLIAVVVAGGENFDDIDVYIDGTLFTNPWTAGVNAPIDIAGTGSTVTFGNDHTETRPYNGILDDVAIFGEALSVAQLDDIAVNGIPYTLPPLLSLEVNTVNGAVKIVNETSGPGSVDFDFYRVSSTAGSLDTADWDSLCDQDLPAFPAGDGSGNGWEEAGGSDALSLGEAYLQDSSTFADGLSVDIGNVFDTDDPQDITFRYRDTTTGLFVDGTVEYVSASFLEGDFNEDTNVDGTDLGLWGDGFGTATGAQHGDGDADGDLDVDGNDFLIWQQQFGQSSGCSASAVPEPTTAGLLGLLLAGLTLGFLWNGKGICRVGLLFGLGVIVLVLVSHTVMADRTVDRMYFFGDDDPSATHGDYLYNSETVDSVGATPDDLQELLDLSFDLTYVDVGTSGLGRPGAGAGELGIVFTQPDPEWPQYMQGDRLGLPSTSASSTTGGGSYDYSGIDDRGFQLWVRPATLGGEVQDVVMDTEQHGVRISAAGNWVMVYNAGTEYDSGVAATADTWHHVMVVRPLGSTTGARMYVDGIAVAAGTGNYDGSDNTPLVVGANTGTSPGTTNPFTGVVDDMEMFVLGTSDGDPPVDYGTFDFVEDNGYAASALSEMVAGDLTGDGLVKGDGSGGMAEHDDIGVFIQNWEAETGSLVNDSRIIDLSCRDKGDFDFNGTVDLLDWHVLTTNHENHAAGVNLMTLLAGVPEPSALCILLLSAFGFVLPLWRRFNR